MKKIFNICFSLINLYVKLYVKALKITGLYNIIQKSDFLFGIYVIPLRIRTVFKYKLTRGYSLKYCWDLLSKRYFKYRKGECKCCGGCCFDCPNLFEEAGKKLCKIYKRREWCDIYFPISPEDLEWVKTNFHAKDCSFSFEVPD